MTTGPYPHSNGVLSYTYLGGSARERSMLTVFRHLLAGADFTFWEYYDETRDYQFKRDKGKYHIIKI